MGAPEGTNSMAMSGPRFGNILVGTGWTNSLVLRINKLRKQSSYLIRSPFVAMKFFPGVDEWLLAQES